MRKKMRKFFCTLMTVLICSALVGSVSVAEAAEQYSYAQELASSHGYLWARFFQIQKMDLEKQGLLHLYTLYREVKTARGENPKPAGMLNWLQLKIEVQLETVKAGRRKNFLSQDLPAVIFGVVVLFRPDKFCRILSTSF